MKRWKGLLAAVSTIATMLAPGVVSAQVTADPQVRTPGIAELGLALQTLAGDRRVRFNDVVTNAPYSADVTSTVTQVLSDGTRIQQSVSGKVYRDVAGRMRREQQVLGLDALNATTSPASVITITDPTTQTTYTLNEQAKTATKAPYQRVLQWNTPVRWTTGFGVADLDPAAPELVAIRLRTDQATPDAFGAYVVNGLSVRRTVRIDDADLGQAARQGGGRGGRGGGNAPTPSAATAPESLGSRQMEGVVATGSRWTETIPTGQIGNDRPISITDEVWESPELQVTVYSKHHDPRSGDVEYRLRNISRNEPSAALFQVPAGYTIVDPLQPFASAPGTRTGGGRGRGGAPGQ